MPCLCEECEHDLIPGAASDEFPEWARREVRDTHCSVIVSATDTRNTEDPGYDIRPPVLNMLSERCLHLPLRLSFEDTGRELKMVAELIGPTRDSDSDSTTWTSPSPGRL
jgi:hypothetical protein